MIGAIAGDVIGSVHEHSATKIKDFALFHEECRFTDDTVLSIATAQAILTNGDYFQATRDLGRKYPGAGYGASFARWLRADDPRPYNSWGNEDAIRNAVSLGGDADTIACIAGGIAEAYYGPVSVAIAGKVRECLTDDLWGIVERFRAKYGIE